MILGLIPSRLGSTRLKKKPLLEINGLPIIIHTLKRAELSKRLTKIIVCTDSKEIMDMVKKHGGDCVITSKKHINGTERIIIQN
jgi:3-deoxy-manno-octulosonate cytidylyltransferase (CMP-KDO synthetase)